MNEIQIEPSKILANSPVVVRIPKELVPAGVQPRLLLESPGEKVEVPLKSEKEVFLGEFSLAKPGSYQVLIGEHRKPFEVLRNEDLSFAIEFWLLAICVVVLLIGFIRWDWTKKKSKPAAGSF